MKIKKITIQGLYGRKRCEMAFDDHVSILAGLNGSFKTTLLDIINQVTNHEEVERPVRFVRAEYSDDVSLEYNSWEQDVETLIKDKERSKGLLDLIEERYPDFFENNKANNYKIKIVAYIEKKNQDRISEQEYLQMKKIDYVSTFDVRVKDIKENETILDSKLRSLQEGYAFFLSDLTRQVSTCVEEMGSITKDQMAQIYKDRDVFISIINSSISDSNKKIAQDESKITFITERGERIPVSRLSAGEKQLLILYLTVLLERKEEFIVLLDEPEISLHVGQQYYLIDRLKELNPNAQFIISTHSPSIFGAGWGDRVVYIEDLIKEDGSL